MMVTVIKYRGCRAALITPDMKQKTMWCIIIWCNFKCVLTLNPETVFTYHNKSNVFFFTYYNK